MASEKLTLTLRLYGSFLAQWSDGTELRLSEVKLQALIALVACAPGRMQTRASLQAFLWGRDDESDARSKLRRALFSLKEEMNERFDSVFELDGERIGIKRGSVRFIGGLEDGQFLQGIEIEEEGFRVWLRERRNSAEPVHRPAQGYQGSQAKLDSGDNPRIAVLPLEIYPTGSSYPYFGDALAQELARALASSHRLDVVSHLSSRSLQSQSVDLSGAGKALDVDYLVFGRCMARGPTLFMDIELHDTLSGASIWTQRFRGSIKEFFSGDAEFIAEIATEVALNLLSDLPQLAAPKPLPTISAHARLISAISLMHHMAPSNFARAMEHLTELTEIAPAHPAPWAWQAQWHLLNVFQGWSETPALDGDLAWKAAKHALDIDPSGSLSRTVYANVHMMLESDFVAGERNFAQALLVNPSSAFATQLKSLSHAYLGEGKEAVRLSKRARALSPLDPRKQFFDGLGATAHLARFDYNSALDLANASLQINPRHVVAHRARIISLHLMGRTEDARAAVQELLQRNPNLTADAYFPRLAAAGAGPAADWALALAEAGLPWR